MKRGEEWLWLVLGFAILKGGAMKTSLDRIVLRWPVRVHGASGRGGSKITQEFRPPSHMGVDISVPGAYKTAIADVLAVAPGRVKSAVQSPRGWSVLIDHGDFASGYLHLAEIDGGIYSGATVSAGQLLGRMGADPLDAERIVHLHLQLAPAGVPVNPAPYLAAAVS